MEKRKGILNLFIDLLILAAAICGGFTVIMISIYLIPEIINISTSSIEKLFINLVLAIGTLFLSVVSVFVGINIVSKKDK